MFNSRVPTRLGQKGAAALHLPPEQSDQRKEQQVEIVTMEEGHRGRPGPRLPGLHDAMSCGSQGCDGEYDHRQDPSGQTQQERSPADSNRHSRQFVTPAAQAEKDISQHLDDPGGQKRANGHRRHGQKKPLSQPQESQLPGGGAAALQHGDFAGPRPDDKTGYQGQVIDQYARHQEHHQEEGDPGQQQLFFKAAEDAVQSDGEAGISQPSLHLPLNSGNPVQDRANIPGPHRLPVQEEIPGCIGVRAPGKLPKPG